MSGRRNREWWTGPVLPFSRQRADACQSWDLFRQQLLLRQRDLLATVVGPRESKEQRSFEARGRKSGIAVDAALAAEAAGGEEALL